MSQLINNTLGDPACEEALNHPAPSLPFPYMANPLMNKFKRLLLETFCECDCTRSPQTLEPSRDGAEIHVTVHPTDTGALDGLLLFFLVLTAVVIFLLRKRLSIAKKSSAIFESNSSSIAPWIFRSRRQVN